jgi:hypothetical protein
MNRRIVNGIVISIDTHEENGTPLNDSPLEDRKAILAEDDDGDEFIGRDQESTVVTLEYLERRDRLDRQRYSV